MLGIGWKLKMQLPLCLSTISRIQSTCSGFESHYFLNFNIRWRKVLAFCVPTSLRVLYVWYLAIISANIFIWNFIFIWPCISAQFVLITKLTHFFNVFISLLYMFRATQSSSWGESIVSIHHLVYITQWVMRLSPVIQVKLFMLITNLTHFLMCLFHFSTCFEQPRAHHQENQLYQYIIWYISLSELWDYHL